MMGQRYSTFDSSFVTKDNATMCASYHEYFNKDGYLWDVETVEDVHFIRISKKERLWGDNAQIYRQILSQAMIDLIKMGEKFLLDPKTKLIGYNTDCIFIETPNKIPKLKNKTLID